MAELVRAKDPFRFYTRLHLAELTGLRASNLTQMVTLLKQVPDSCIYHHTHRFLQQHQELSPEPPNDFAYWVTTALREDELGESLASIDIMLFSNIRTLREKLVATVEHYLETEPMAKLSFARQGDEFYFLKSVSFVIPTVYEVYDLREFADVLRKVTIDSIYFHIFEARLRLEKQTNDFSNWIETNLQDKDLAKKIASFDPYTRTLDDLRKKLMQMIERRIAG